MRRPLVLLVAPLVALVSLPPSPAGAQTAMDHARRCVELVNARSDLERAVEVQSGETLHNESLLVQERQVLQRLVELTDLSAAEMMRSIRR